jgi:hypothetical protein
MDNDGLYYIDATGNYIPPYTQTKQRLGYIKTGSRFVRAGQSLFKGNFDGTKVVAESVDQHKYSRLASASYHFKNQSKADDILSKLEETKHFQLDKELSTEEHSILHNPVTNETVIAFRGTSNLKDVATDSLVLTSQELKSSRLKDSERVFEATAEKYGTDKLTTTGHSLGSTLSLHTAEKYDVEGHHFNPAVSARQANQSYSGALANNTEKQIIYRTHGDVVSVGGEFTEAPLSNREIVRVNVRPENTGHFVAHHQLDNFYTDDGVREGNMIKSEKATLLSTGLDTLDTSLKVGQLGLGVYDAVDGAEKREDTTQYAHQVSEDFNPLMGINLDPDFQWTNTDVITPLRRVGKALRTKDRRKQDRANYVENRLINNQTQTHSVSHTYYQVENSKSTRTDESFTGVRYTDESYNLPSAKRRAPRDVGLHGV